MYSDPSYISAEIAEGFLLRADMESHKPADYQTFPRSYFNEAGVHGMPSTDLAVLCSFDDDVSPNVVLLVSSCGAVVTACQRGCIEGLMPCQRFCLFLSTCLSLLTMSSFDMNAQRLEYMV